MSEDIDELYAISDRIGAICDGRLSPTASVSDVSIGQLGQWMAGDFESQLSRLESRHDCELSQPDSMCRSRHYELGSFATN